MKLKKSPYRFVPYLHPENSNGICSGTIITGNTCVTVLVIGGVTMVGLAHIVRISSAIECYNGGYALGYHCTCRPGWSGSHCEGIAYSYYGQSDNHNDHHFCTCDSRWTGTHCETIVCYHGAAQQSHCTCDASYTGSHCDGMHIIYASQDQKYAAWRGAWKFVELFIDVSTARSICSGVRLSVSTFGTGLNNN